VAPDILLTSPMVELCVFGESRSLGKGLTRHDTLHFGGLVRDYEGFVWPLLSPPLIWEKVFIDRVRSL
jgi:hypothetical protein